MDTVMTNSAVQFDTRRLDALKLSVRNREQKRFRTSPVPDLVTECDAEGLLWPARATRLARRMCEAEQPVVLDNERIVFTRTVPTVPPIYSPGAWVAATAGRTLHELGPISNICADWGMVLSQGLLGRRQAALAAQNGSNEFLTNAIETIDAVLALAARYEAEARRLGRNDVAETLAQVPAKPPRTFREALQMLRLLHAVVWMNGHYHVGLGRFDQYMAPYLETDFAAGRLDIAAAEELLAEFFISLNKDSDLYPGVQQGDNGQSLMLGGVRPDGSDGVNELTRMTLRVALYTAMIDPKINLRISGETDVELLRLASLLTRQGLGFPQYSNDDIVIPALVKQGYTLEDARNYTVAACWEFIIPGKGMEVVNIGAVSFPLAADRAIRQGFTAHESMEQILARVDADIHEQARQAAEPYRRLLLPPAPYYSVLMNGCLERGADLSHGLVYNNFGIHGAAASNAADALAAVSTFVFGDHSLTARELLRALDANFDGYAALQERLSTGAPKVGQNGPADRFLRFLYDSLGAACEALGPNGRGGHFRAGSGSAMYYVWLSRGKPGDTACPIGATAEGRRAGEFFSANLSPSLNAHVNGPISVLQSFAKIDYEAVSNGGPITLELSDSVFQDDESITKCALLVRAFAQIGCQQLQLNTLNRAALLDAKVHPERHRNLIVRVWGWSGYFCELAPEYQDHVIARTLHQV
jgi:formate C-acetyltransferase